MKRLLLLFMLLGTSAFGQQNATLSGIIKSEGDIPEGTRVAVHVVNSDGVWLREVASAVPVAGTFSVETVLPEGVELKQLRSGALPLPGMQNEYRISPDDVNYIQGRINVYIDNNANNIFDDSKFDTPFLGIASLEAPSGFFSLIYVDKDAVLSGKGVDLELQQGWNIFTVRYPEGEPDLYEAQMTVDDAVLDIFLPQ